MRLTPERAEKSDNFPHKCNHLNHEQSYEKRDENNSKHTHMACTTYVANTVISPILNEEK